MRYSIITCINGNFAVKAEYTALDKAKVGFHQQFNGYVKKGSVLSSSRLTQAGNTQIWSLL